MAAPGRTAAACHPPHLPVAPCHLPPALRRAWAPCWRRLLPHRLQRGQGSTAVGVALEKVEARLLRAAQCRPALAAHLGPVSACCGSAPPRNCGRTCRPGREASRLVSRARRGARWRRRRRCAAPGAACKRPSHPTSFSAPREGAAEAQGATGGAIDQKRAPVLTGIISSMPSSAPPNMSASGGSREAPSGRKDMAALELSSLLATPAALCRAVVCVGSEEWVCTRWEEPPSSEAPPHCPLLHPLALFGAAIALLRENHKLVAPQGRRLSERTSAPGRWRHRRVATLRHAFRQTFKVPARWTLPGIPPAVMRLQDGAPLCTAMERRLL